MHNEGQISDEKLKETRLLLPGIVLALFINKGGVTRSIHNRENYETRKIEFY